MFSPVLPVFQGQEGEKSEQWFAFFYLLKHFSGVFIAGITVFSDGEHMNAARIDHLMQFE